MNLIYAIQKAGERTAELISDLFGVSDNYAFAGISDSYRNPCFIQNPEQTASLRDYACFSHSGRKTGTVRSKGNTHLHHPSKTIEGIDISDVPKSQTVKDFLISKGLSPKRVIKAIKQHK